MKDNEKLFEQFAENLLESIEDTDYETLKGLIKAGANFNKFLKKKEEKKEHILNVVKGLIAALCYYDRKKDEDLSQQDLYNAVKSGVVTVEEIVKTFETELKNVF